MQAGARVPFRLYLISDRKLAAPHGGLPAVVRTVLRAASTTAMGARAIAVQLREKDLEARELYELALTLREICTRFDAALIVNDRIDVAIAAAADGVHLPANSFDVADARRLLGPAGLIGVSAHRSEDIVAAREAGADFSVFGPVYDPLSKAAPGPASGANALGAACRAAGPMPVYALGGITARRVRELSASAAFAQAGRPAGAAVIGAVMGADDPAAATLELLAAIAAW